MRNSEFHKVTVFIFLISLFSPLMHVSSNLNNILIPLEPKQGSIQSWLNLKNAYAIIVGIEEYLYIDDLDYCREDALSMQSFLITECNFKSENIILLLNSSATFDRMNLAFSEIRSKIGPNDIFLFYFAGHGGSLNFSSHFICAYDSNINTSKNMYVDHELDAKINLLGCKENYIFIDACSSGGLIPELQSSRSYIMTACRINEDSIETDELKHGIFTYYLINSKDKELDLNDDNMISIEEQYSYVYSNVKIYSASKGKPQHPECYEGFSGQSILSPH